MIVRNLNQEEVMRRWYVAHGGGAATMLFDASELKGLLFFAHGIVKPGKEIEAHVDTYEEIYYVLAGRGVMTVGEERRPVSAGDAIWLPYGVPHRLQNDGDEDCIVLVAAAMPRPYR